MNGNLTPNTLDLQAHMWVTNPPTRVFGTRPLVGSQWLDVNFHPWKFNLELIITLSEQQYNNLSILGNYAPTLGQHVVEVVPFGFGWVRPTMLHHSYKPLGHWSGSLPHRQETLCLSPKSWDQTNIFP